MKLVAIYVIMYVCVKKFVALQDINFANNNCSIFLGVKLLKILKGKY